MLNPRKTQFYTHIPNIPNIRHHCERTLVSTIMDVATPNNVAVTAKGIPIQNGPNCIPQWNAAAKVGPPTINPAYVTVVTLVNDRLRFCGPASSVNMLRAVTVKAKPSAIKDWPRTAMRGTPERKINKDPIMRQTPLMIVIRLSLWV